MNLKEYLGNAALVQRARYITTALRSVSVLLVDAAPPDLKACAAGILACGIEWLKELGVTDEEIRATVDATLELLTKAQKLAARSNLEVVK